MFSWWTSAVIPRIVHAIAGPLRTVVQSSTRRSVRAGMHAVLAADGGVEASAGQLLAVDVRRRVRAVHGVPHAVDQLQPRSRHSLALRGFMAGSAARARTWRCRPQSSRAPSAPFPWRLARPAAG